MIRYKHILGIFLSALLFTEVQAASWTTHFAYNNVTKIAMTPDKVFGLSDGNLFSVDKQTEQMSIYNRQSGLHSTGISCICYDEVGRQLIIGYETGKIDILSERGVHYVGALYDKDMTQRKTIYNVTIKGRIAYLSTHYGIQTMDLREYKLVDSYWLRPGGEETPVKDVMLTNDSIYAFTDDSLFCASMSDNIVDYHFWKRELRSGRISPDPDKGVHYFDGLSEWWADYNEGIVRFTPTDRIVYKPNGPHINKPNRICVSNEEVWVTPGGRWAVQDFFPGSVMHYDGNEWKNIDRGTITKHGCKNVWDFMNVAVDPNDRTHFYATSYGTGLYEFIGDSIHQYIADGTNILCSAAPNDPAGYTRLDYATYDKNGHLWFVEAGTCTVVPYQLICIDKDGQWHGLSAIEGSNCVSLETPTGLIIDALNDHYKWFSNGREGTRLCLLNDGGTLWDQTDDILKSRFAWTDQLGNAYQPNLIFALIQDKKGRVWIGTDVGTAYIEHETDFFTSDSIIRPYLLDELGEMPLTEQKIQAFCQTPNGEIWIGTNDKGIYVLDSEASQIIQHYSIDNSALPSNGILSLACSESGVVWIGTGEGLVAYDPNGSTERLNTITDENGIEWEFGSTGQWKMHLSYSDPTEIIASPGRIYAQAQGSVFYLDRSTDQLNYLSRATGLKGTSASHIAYDERSEQLIIAYKDGRIDLMDNNDHVRQMPDLPLKAGSINVAVHCITPGTKYTYLGTSFGIVTVNMKKAEIADTYYIGHEAASIEVQQIVEMGDTLYAFSYDSLYKACLKDNLPDYTFWHTEKLPCEQVQQALVWRDKMYILYNNHLYLRKGSKWETVLQENIKWIHVNDGQLLVYMDTGLFQLTEDNQLILLTNRYAMNDAIYSKGEYWVAEYGFGLIKLSTEGESYYHTEGPNSNYGYSMTTSHNQLYSAIGGRWAEQWQRYGRINIYDGQNWRTIDPGIIASRAGNHAIDICSIAVDPKDPGHFFAATYGTGVFEFKNYGDDGIKQYTADTVYHTTTLREAQPGIGQYYYYYIRTDGAMMDQSGNLWVLNATTVGKPLHILTPNGQWFGLNLRSGGTNLTLETPAGIWVDRRNENRKWMFDQRMTQGVILLDDGGTPTINTDDRCIKRSSFTDQNGNVITPSFFRCWAQDKNDRIWIGTERGIILIPAKTDFFTSDACHRIIIPRNDGTGLGDYLLGNEMINCMAVDGGNRMWIGTATSGLYVIEDDTITVAHFTENNSLLPSNAIQSIAIMPKTGEVFVGTDKGIASYRSDSSEPQESMSGAYAFPNPVRPDYIGYITITGLTENTTVNIIDEGGNLVCKTRSNGGTAVWDGKLPDGRRATPGVYTALCNSAGGHTAIKILVIH